jgi:hypothetical protein
MATSGRRKTTTEQGLGWRHQQAVAGLKRRHRDGTPCDWCGQPMYLAAERNWDYDADKPGSGTLHADHGAMTRAEAVRRGIPIPLPDRLLHGRCNQQRGDGVNDHLAAVNRGIGQPERLSLSWPW